VAVVYGVVARLIHYDDTLLGDELSTLYIVQDHGLRDVIHLVRTDAEITPPLYFVLAWLSAQLGSAPDLVRLPALLAGLAAIPLSFLVARRLFGYSAGLVAAMVMALNPFMIYHSVNARSYTLAIALLLASTLTMLIAAERRKPAWWAAYAVFTVLAMYTHYTAAFVLAAQLLWLLWARPDARIPGLIATGAAAVAYLPWVPSAIDDSHSPTVDILSALQGNGVATKIRELGEWTFGFPFNSVSRLPGTVFLVIGVAALGLLVVGTAIRLLPRLRAKDGLTSDRTQALVLAAALALATPVGEAVILLLGGTDLFGTRNFNTAAGGFAVLIGGMSAEAAPAIAAVAVAGLIGVFAVGTAKTFDPTHSTVDFADAAHFIKQEAAPGDVIVDMVSTQLSPVPTTPLEAEGPGDRPVINIYQPLGPPPYISPYPPPGPILRRAVHEADGHRVFVVSVVGAVRQTATGVRVKLTGANVFIKVGGNRTVYVNLPGWRIEARRVYHGYGDVVVSVLRPPS
jgi:hypothetical protein